MIRDNRTLTTVLRAQTKLNFHALINLDLPQQSKVSKTGLVTSQQDHLSDPDTSAIQPVAISTILTIRNSDNKRWRLI